MPRFFFDLYDGDELARDTEGFELQPEEARKQAIASLAEIAQDEMPDGDERDFTVRVRDEDGHVIFEATLSLRAHWVTDQR